MRALARDPGNERIRKNMEFYYRGGETVTIRETIDMADSVKPNVFDTATKLFWLNRLEGALAAEIFLMAPEEIAQLKYTALDMGAELLVDAPYDDIYELWLEAWIDRANGEYNKYQNTAQIYNARRAEFVTWFCQTWDPAQGYRKEVPRSYGYV